MHSFLIVGQNQEELLGEAKKLARQRKIDPIDISVFEDEKIFGIDTFRQLKEKIFLKPIRSPGKAIILDLFKGATVEAQNAMLKALEEPPPSTIMIILGKKKDAFLPTIISRCEVIELKNEVIAGDGRQLEEILSGGIGKKLVAAQDLAKDKDEAIKFAKDSILYLRAKMKKDALSGGTSRKTALMIRDFEKAHYALSETNINPRMTLENLFLSL
jgi:DNA polymerase III delta prime subunit